MECRNLALGKSVIIKTAVPTVNSYASVEKGRRNVLTDGNNGDPSSCYGGDWVHFYRGVGRELILDLEDEYAVVGFDVGFIHDRSAGIYCPENVKFSVSSNGIEYYKISCVDSPYPASFEMQTRAVYASSIETPVRARYVKLSFGVEVNAFCDEIRVYGGEIDGYTAYPSGSVDKDVDKNAFADRNSLGGVYDMPLMYFGYWPDNERIARVKKEDLVPYVAYVDKNGKMIDTMFDSMLFLMIQGKCPSGGCLSYYGEPSVLSDWEYIIDELFLESCNLKALDEVVYEAKKELGLPKDYKHKVYLTAPVPKISLEPFGDMNGDGIEEKLLCTEDCVEAYAWYVDQVTRRFEAECMQNIVIDGWFWNNESASRTARDDESYFAKRCVDELHKRGYKCVFIPYLQAGGCEKADEIGFDCTTMQPNLSFQEALQQNPAGMLDDFEVMCKKYGFGIELEIHHGVKNEATKHKYGELFLEYMRACVKNGMMADTVHTYYQAAGPGVFHTCAYSKDEYLRSVYDKLYKFIKGELTLDDFDVSVAHKEPETISASEGTTESVQPIAEVEAIEATALESENESADEITADKSVAEEFEISEAQDHKEQETVTLEQAEKIYKKPKKDINKMKKYAKIGAGIAAALGVAYLIAKNAKGKD